MLKSLGINRRILILFLVLAGATFGFFAFASEVMEGETLAIDRSILLALRTPGDVATPIGPRWLKLAMIDITALGGFTLLTIITIGAAGYLIAVRKYVVAAVLALSVASGVLLSSLLKLAYLRLRPDIVPHLVEVQTSSFPSGHAVNAAVTYLTIGALIAGTERRPGVRVYLMASAISLTLAVGISRVYLGVHWPSDVLAGWCIGSTWALGCASVARLVSR